MTQVDGGGVPPGTQLNGIYEIEQRIAAGGMGEVYIGRLIQTGDKVAIKMILPEHANNDLILDLFRKEASTLHGLYHEAIVRYYVFSVDPVLGRPYLAMEYAEGPALGDRVRGGALTADEMAILVPRIAGGLHAAHRAGIVHRDLSPDNIILVDNDVERAKIIDFGIAKAQGSEGTLIGSGFAGKLKYVSPEQLGLAGGEVTAQSDIYSLGLVFAEAATGYPLDMGGSQVEVIEKRRAVPDLTSVPEFIRPLIASMTQPEPADRPATMEEVARWTPPVSARAKKRGAAPVHPRARGTEAVEEKRGSGGLKLLGVLLAGTAVAAVAAFFVLNDQPAGPTGKADDPLASSGDAVVAPSGDTLRPGSDDTTSAAGEATGSDATIALPGGGRTDDANSDSTIALPGGGATGATSGGSDDTIASGETGASDSSTDDASTNSVPAATDVAAGTDNTTARTEDPAPATSTGASTTDEATVSGATASDQTSLTPVRSDATSTTDDASAGSTGLTPVATDDAAPTGGAATGSGELTPVASNHDNGTSASSDTDMTEEGSGSDNADVATMKGTEGASKDTASAQNLVEPTVSTSVPGGLGSTASTELAGVATGGGLRPVDGSADPGRIGSSEGKDNEGSPLPSATDTVQRPTDDALLLTTPGTGTDSSGIVTDSGVATNYLDRSDAGALRLDGGSAPTAPSLATRPIDASEKDPVDELSEPTVNTALPSDGLSAPTVNSGGLAPAAPSDSGTDTGLALPRTGTADAPSAPSSSADDTSRLAAVAAPQNQPPTIRNRAPGTLSAGQGEPLNVRLGEFFDEDGAQNLELRIQGDVPNGLSIDMGRDGIATLSGTPAEYGDYDLKIAAVDSDGLLSQSIEVALTVERPFANRNVRDYIVGYDGGECFLSRAVELGPKLARIEVFAAESEIPKVIAFDEDFKTDNGFEAKIGMRPISPDQCTLVKVLNQVGPQALDNSLVIRLTEDQLTSGDRLAGKIRGGQNARLFLFDNEAGITDLSQFVETRGGETGFALEISGSGPQILIAARPRDGSGLGPEASLNQLLAAAQKGQASLALGFFTLK